MQAPRFLTSWTSLRRESENLPLTFGLAGLGFMLKSVVK